MKGHVKHNNCLKCSERACFLNSLTADQLDLYFKHTVELSFKKGQVICKQGSYANNVFFLKKGLVKLYTEGDQKNIILSVYKPPVYVGLLSQFGNEFYQFSLSAIEDSTICMIEFNCFKEFIKSNGIFGLGVVTYISQSANFILNNKIKLSQKQTRGKVASILLFFYRTIYETSEFNLGLSRKELAEFAGVSTENLITALTEFRKDQLILLDGKKVKILNLAGLENISNRF